ncbi:DUF2799 domain-containing protein [Vibrio mexicanus]|uniref:DUF2799 domain-containing protein n=1 Tax=Vibrio mexicanus TaxID=1004326 RepID=UPI00063C37CA|nr:DUF2799 domain-containing protein [Vibrio mexicanus]
MKAKLSLLIAGFVLAGCSTTGTSMDTVDNWQKYGFDQAVAGKVMIEQNEFTAEDYALYEEGYVVGQKVYCSQDPYKVGMVGKIYNGICDELSDDFQTQYELGRLEYLAMQAKMADN